MSGQFKDDHDRLRRLADEFVILLSGETLPNVNDIMKGRAGFTALFHAHFSAETRALEALRTGNPDSPVDKLLAEHAARLREVHLRHSDLIQRWPIRRIEAEWRTYGREVGAQRDFYVTFLDWEEAFIHPLLGGSSGLRRAS